MQGLCLCGGQREPSRRPRSLTFEIYEPFPVSSLQLSCLVHPTLSCLVRGFFLLLFAVSFSPCSTEGSVMCMIVGFRHSHAASHPSGSNACWRCNSGHKHSSQQQLESAPLAFEGHGTDMKCKVQTTHAAAIQTLTNKHTGRHTRPKMHQPGRGPSLFSPLYVQRPEHARMAALYAPQQQSRVYCLSTTKHTDICRSLLHCQDPCFPTAAHWCSQSPACD